MYILLVFQFFCKEKFSSFFAVLAKYALANRLVLVPWQLLVPLVTSFRYEGDEVNMTLAKSEAKILHEKISDKAYNDEEIIRILTTRSKSQINATLNHYNNAFGNAINKVISICYDICSVTRIVPKVVLSYQIFFFSKFQRYKLID